MGFARRIISTWVATVVFLGVLTCGSQAVAAQPMLGSADTMEKVFRDEAWNRPPVTRLAIEAARNEVQGIQLVVVAGKETVRSANLEISDLTGEAGGSIPKANVAWNVVGYVETERPIYQVRRVGWWPDPLLPPGKFDVPAGQVQPLWINVHVPADAGPGLYRGAVTLRLADGQAQSVPLEVRVWNFTVPKQQHLETYEYFWLLRDALARLKKADAARHQALIAEAEKALAVDDAVVKDLTHFTQDPQVLRQARARIAGLIERATLASPTAQEATEPAPGSAAALPRWDMDTLAKSPKVYPADAPTAKDVTSVFYEGLPWRKKPTRVFAYPMDSLQKSYRLAPGPHTLCVRLRMPHGHAGPGENPAEILAFADSQLKHGQPLAKITGQGRNGEQVWIAFEAASPIQRAELNYTRETGRWQARKWDTIAAEIDTATHKVTARLPQGVKVYYLSLIDQRNLVVSAEHCEIP